MITGLAGAGMIGSTIAQMGLGSTGGLGSILGSAASGIGSFMNSNFGGGLMSGLGSLVGGLFSNSSNAKQASKNRRMIRWLAKNRYQLMVDDLRKAGINPIYAVQGGSAPSVTGGSVPHMSDVVTPAIGSAISVAGAISKIQNDRDIAKSQVALNKANALNAATNAAAQLERNPYEASLIQEKISNHRATTSSLLADAFLKGMKRDFDMYYGWDLRDIDLAKEQLQLKIMQNAVDSMKSPTWNKGVGYGKDVFDLLGGAVGSAVGVGKFVNILNHAAKRR